MMKNFIIKYLILLLVFTTVTFGNSTFTKWEGAKLLDGMTFSLVTDLTLVRRSSLVSRQARCPPGTSLCSNNSCCGQNQECVPGGCCPRGHGQCPNSRICCPKGSICCGNKGCCGQNQECTPDGCCPRGYGQCPNSRTCCPKDGICCENNRCCGKNQECVPGGCCPRGYGRCPNSKKCCPIGTKCSPNGCVKDKQKEPKVPKLPKKPKKPKVPKEFSCYLDLYGYPHGAKDTPGGVATKFGVRCVSSLHIEWVNGTVISSYSQISNDQVKWIDMNDEPVSDKVV